MAANNLTPEQDILTREFFIMVNSTDYLKDHPAHRRSLNSFLLEALNYQVLPNGAYVSKDTKVTVTYGSGDYSAWPDEWADDTRRAHEALNSKDTTEADTSSEAADTEVREAVLPEDV